MEKESKHQPSNRTKDYKPSVTILNSDLDRQTIEELGKFSILWGCFEKQYCSNNCNFGNLKKAVQAVKEVEIHTSLLQSALQMRINEIGIADTGEYFKEGLFPEGAHVPKNKDTIVNAMVSFFSEGKSLFGCFLCMYRIRNNLMHGLKCVQELNLQYKLFQACNAILEDVLNSSRS